MCPQWLLHSGNSHWGTSLRLRTPKRHFRLVSHLPREKKPPSRRSPRVIRPHRSILLVVDGKVSHERQPDRSRCSSLHFSYRFRWATSAWPPERGRIPRQVDKTGDIRRERRQLPGSWCDNLKMYAAIKWITRRVELCRTFQCFGLICLFVSLIVDVNQRERFVRTERPAPETDSGPAEQRQVWRFFTGDVGAIAESMDFLQASLSHTY
jgi:hypothetical protein